MEFLSTQNGSSSGGSGGGLTETEVNEIVTVAIANKVDKDGVKVLSTEDYTTAEQTKLKGIATSANNYTHPTRTGNKHIPSGGATGNVLNSATNSATSTATLSA